MCASVVFPGRREAQRAEEKYEEAKRLAQEAKARAEKLEEVAKVCACVGDNTKILII